MSQAGPSLAQESMSAVRGIAALLVGDRNAAGYFDLSPRGMASAALAFLVVVGATHFGPVLMGAMVPGVGRSALLLCFLMAMQIGGGVILLGVLRRQDAYAPFITTTLWASLFVSVASFAAAFTGLPGGIVVTIFGIMLLVIEVNIGRLIVTLPPVQVAGLVGAQLLGSFIGLMIAGSVITLPQELSVT